MSYMRDMAELLEDCVDETYDCSQSYVWNVRQCATVLKSLLDFEANSLINSRTLDEAEEVEWECDRRWLESRRTVKHVEKYLQEEKR